MANYFRLVMKKTFYTGMALSCLLLTSLSARTWTNADGTNTFSGDFKGFDAETEVVSVVKSGRTLSFTLDKLSEADQTWVKAAAKEAAEAAAKAANTKKLSEQEVGSKLTSKVLSRLNGKRFARADIEKSPEYYILYFSASW